MLEALENSSENTSTHDTNGFQKFLCIVDRHEKTDVLLNQLSQKSGKTKSQIFHASQLRKGIFEIPSFS